MRGRLKRSGAAVVSLNESDITLNQIFAVLKLRPLSRTTEEEVRSRLKALIGRWSYHIADFQDQEMKLRVTDAKATLKSMLGMFKEIKRILSSTDDGLCDTQENGSVGLLAEMMGNNPQIQGIPAARLYLRDFTMRSDTIAHACLMVIHELDASKGMPGAPRFDWYRDFTELMRSIAVANGIKPVVIINRRTQEPQGRFIEVVEKFELLFPAKMRCPTRGARAQRLSRALRKLRDA
jgi:hypothetical protein